MNALLLLADGFETTEALLTYDLLCRSHLFKTTLCSIKKERSVVSSHGVHVEAETTLDQIDRSAFDMVILPGGKLGTENLGASEEVHCLISDFLSSGKDVHAICAAPSILGKYGYLDNIAYTCFPGFQTGKGTWLDQGVVVTPHTITGRSMGYTMDFAKAIIAHYYGQEAVERIRAGVEGLA